MKNLKTQNREFPLRIKFGFQKIFDFYRAQLSTAAGNNKWVKDILSIAEEYPELSTGVSSLAELKKYKPQITTVLQFLFPQALENSEAKFLTVPFQNFNFKCTKHYREIISTAGKDFQLDIINLNEEEFYIMGCILILNQYYGRKVNFRRSFQYDIPDERGMIKNYRVVYNYDFIEVERTKKAKTITEEDFLELLESYDDISVWKEKFPPESYIFKGFVIANLIDVTTDVTISEFKTDLLRLEWTGGFENTNFTQIFRSLFDLGEVEVGFTEYNEESELFDRILFKEISSFILNGEKTKMSREALCSTSYYTLFKQKEFYVIIDSEYYHNLYPDNILYKKLLDQGLRSAIFASVISNNKVLGILEVVSPNPNELNTINANKLKLLMPFIVDSVVRAKENLENELELIIQEECTSLHSSVHWKFRKEALRYFTSLTDGNPSIFREVVFPDVFPLYGQTDIKGSSEARNEATKQDLLEQLNYVSKVLEEMKVTESLPILEQMLFTIEGFLQEITENLQVDTEQKIIGFLSADIIPLFEYLSKTNKGHQKHIEEYNSLIDINTGLVYKHRRDYDETVMLINKKLVSIIDNKQQEAQKMFPHYFERFKTDGVEHNLYIGASITKTKVFHTIYLKNLKLWQLQVICEMENTYYRVKDQLPITLDVASMILAFSGSLSLRFRMDEKRFDVDGTYNARYEVVKKRVDKALIKGTQERITQPGKITIVYSQREEEEEYLSYIKFLQHKKLLGEEVEMVELEDLQGVTGLKAIRVNILYSKNADNSKQYYTYNDLISELHD
ncbi:MAG: GAF domain-containing protein [Aequorivita sp.]